MGSVASFDSSSGFTSVDEYPLDLLGHSIAAPPWYRVHAVKEVASRIFYLIGVISLVGVGLATLGFPYVVFSDISIHAAVAGVISLLFSSVIRNMTSWSDPKYIQNRLVEMISTILTTKMPFKEAIVVYAEVLEKSGSSPKKLAEHLNRRCFFDQEVQRLKTYKAFISVHGEEVVEHLSSALKERLSKKFLEEYPHRRDYNLLSHSLLLGLSFEEKKACEIRAAKNDAYVLAYDDFRGKYGVEIFEKLGESVVKHLQRSYLKYVVDREKRFKEIQSEERKDLTALKVEDKDVLEILLRMKPFFLEDFNSFEAHFGVESIPLLSPESKRRLAAAYLERDWGEILRAPDEIVRDLGITCAEVTEIIGKYIQRASRFSEVILCFGRELFSSELPEKFGGTVILTPAALNALQRLFKAEVETMALEYLYYGYEIGLSSEEFRSLLQKRWTYVDWKKVFVKEKDFITEALQSKELFSPQEVRGFLLNSMSSLKLTDVQGDFKDLFILGILYLSDIWPANQKEVENKESLTAMALEFGEIFFDTGVLETKYKKNHNFSFSDTSTLIRLSHHVHSLAIERLIANLEEVDLTSFQPILDPSRFEDRLILDYKLMDAETKLVVKDFHELTSRALKELQEYEKTQEAQLKFAIDNKRRLFAALMESERKKRIQKIEEKIEETAREKERLSLAIKEKETKIQTFEAKEEEYSKLVKGHYQGLDQSWGDYSAEGSALMDSFSPEVRAEAMRSMMSSGSGREGEFEALFGMLYEINQEKAQIAPERFYLRRLKDEFEFIQSEESRYQEALQGVEEVISVMHKQKSGQLEEEINAMTQKKEMLVNINKGSNLAILRQGRDRALVELKKILSGCVAD